MDRTEHIAEAERLLDSAKEVSKRPKETDQDRKADEDVVFSLLSFVNCHARIAAALR